MLPKDPMILLSYVNTRLRDDYLDLDALCEGLDVEKDALTETLGAAGFLYDPETNCFR